jgi:hypothetical protein
MRGGDERATVFRPREDDVARLIADEQSAGDAARCAGADGDDADAVGEVMDHPDLAVRT